MKKIVLVILTGILLASCSNNSNLTEQECLNSDFYYYSGSKVYLKNLNFNYIVLGFTKETDNVQIVSFINNLDAFQNISENDIFDPNGGYKFLFAKFINEKSCIEINSEIESLINNSILVYVNKTYNTDFYGQVGSYDLMYTTDEFIIKLKGSTTKSQLDQLISQTTGVSIINEDEFEPNKYLVSNINKNRTTIQTANLFYETQLFEYSEPNFGYVNF